VQAIRNSLNGNLDINEAIKLFDCKNHPDYISGLKSKSTLIADFMVVMGGNEIGWPEFQRYYRAVSACVSPRDFEQMVRQMSQKSGRVEWSFLRK
jgi:hypothetical protein